MKKNKVVSRLVLHALQHLAAVGLAVMLGIIAVNYNILEENMYG